MGLDKWQGCIELYGVFVWRTEPDHDTLAFDSMTDVLRLLSKDLGSEFTITFKPGKNASQSRFTVLEHPWKDAVA